MSIRNGKKIPLLKKGELLGGNRAQDVIRTCNAFLNGRISKNKAGRNGLKISQENSVFEVSDDLAGDGVAFMFPFKIYNFPQELRRFRTDDDFRRVKVRGGGIIGGFEITDAIGSDGAHLGSVFGTNSYSTDILASQVPPSDATAISGDGTWNEAIIPDDGNAYDIWFSFVDGMAEVSPIYESVLLFGNNSAFNGDSSGRLASAVSLSSGNTLSTVSYRGFSDAYNYKIGTCAVISGKLVIGQLETRPNIQCVNPLATQDNISPQLFNFKGFWSNVHKYYVGDVVLYDEITHSDGGLGTPNHYGFRYQFLYWPASASSTYSPVNSGGSCFLNTMDGVDPTTNNPDPWVMLSSSPIRLDSGGRADWTTGAYDPSKWYLRAG